MNPTHTVAPSADTATPASPSAELLRPLAPGDDEPVIALLKAGIPLSLLLDLAGGDLHSDELYEVEGVDSDAFAHLQ